MSASLLSDILNVIKLNKMYPPLSSHAQPILRVGLFKTDNLLRKRLSDLFTCDPRLRLVFSASEIPYEMLGLPEIMPDVALYSLDTSSDTFVKYVNQINERFPLEKVVILKGVVDPVFTQQVKKAGANGLLLTINSLNYIRDTILDIPKTVLPIQTIAVKHLLEISASPSLGDFLTLTKREIEIIEILKCGVQNKLAADLLKIKLSTMNQHLKQIYKKLKINAKKELIVMTKNKFTGAKKFRVPLVIQVNIG